MSQASIPFTKMQGLGNDFVVIDDLGKARAEPLTAALARQICDRRLGVGADQILWLKAPSDPSADARMEIFNADGSVAEMCGNGIRAVALYLDRYGFGANRPRKPAYSIETLGGMKTVRLLGDNQVSVDMGQAQLGAGFGARFSFCGEPIQISGREIRFFEVNVGNPHAVIFVESVEATAVEELGPEIESHPRFPQRTNVEFVEVTGPSSIRVRVWERGAGITLACGTGACASAVAALATRRLPERQKEAVDVDLPGGRLKIRWSPGEPILMEGPAAEVFRGEFVPKS